MIARRFSVALALVAALALALTAAAKPLPIATTNDVWPTTNAIDQMKKDIHKYKEYKDYQDSAGKAGDAAGKAQKGAKSASGIIDLFESYKALSGNDATSDPNFNPPGSPQVPTSCDEKDSGACSDCYASTYDKLNRVRMNLERLRAVRGSTEEFYKASVSFGDDVSSVHGVAGLAWQAERRKIEQSFAGFKKAYVNKHSELMATLQQVLNEVGACEARHYNNPDWYNRFGYMYYSFMESRYAW